MADDIVMSSAGIMRPANLREALEFAKLVAQSDLVPKDYKGKPGNVLIAVQMGAEIGLAPMQAIQNIAVINGRASLWGDAVLALVKAQPDCEDVIEDPGPSGCTCTILRRGKQPVTRTFTIEDAKQARLWGKQGPWTEYPKRMMQMRARGFAARDAYPDALRGMHVAEEARDIPGETTSYRERPAPETKPNGGTQEAALPRSPAVAAALEKREAVTKAAKPILFSKTLAWDGASKWGGRPLNDADLDTLLDYSTTVQLKATACEPSKRDAWSAHLERVKDAIAAKEPPDTNSEWGMESDNGETVEAEIVDGNAADNADMVS